MPPKGTDRALTSDVQHCERNVLVNDILDMEPWNEPSVVEGLDGTRDKPNVGIVVTTSPSFNLNRMVVFPAASSPTCERIISENFISENFVNSGTRTYH